MWNRKSLLENCVKGVLNMRNNVVIGRTTQIGHCLTGRHFKMNVLSFQIFHNWYSGLHIEEKARDSQILLIISMKLIKGNFTVIFSPFDVYIYNKDEYRLGGKSPLFGTPQFSFLTFQAFIFVRLTPFFRFWMAPHSFHCINGKDYVNDYNLLVSIWRENKI